MYIKPEIGKEESVRHLFSVFAERLGFTILNIQKSFPDCTAIDHRNGRDRIVNIEFEYNAHNFILHRHDRQMDPKQTYIIVCWGRKGDIPANVEVIVLSEKKFIQFEECPLTDQQDFQKPQYRIIGYNTDVAGGLDFSAFGSTKIFCTNTKFKNDELPKGSVIVIYQKGWLIGEFTVSSYIYLERPPKTAYEKKIYELTTYPVTVEPNPLDFLKEEDWFKGHIIYTDFKLYDPRVDFKKLKLNMSRGGSIKLSFEKLQMIRGRRK